MNDTTRDLRVLNLGAGVQSSTVLLMMKSGEIEPADIAIFADTQWEPKAVYEWLDYIETVSTVPIVRVTAGNIRSDALQTEHRFASLPVYILNIDGKPAMGRRQCTNEYKIQPINAEIRRRLGGNLRGKRVEQVFGISLDESRRMRDPKTKWAKHIYPLVDLRMTRHDCKLWMQQNGYPEPPRSACIGCPFRHDVEWRSLTPDEFDDAVQFDKAIRKGFPAARDKGQHILQSAYLHRSLKPLDEVDFSTEEDHGQLVFDNWDAECEGMCGI